MWGRTDLAFLFSQRSHLKVKVFFSLCGSFPIQMPVPISLRCMGEKTEPVPVSSVQPVLHVNPQSLCCDMPEALRTLPAAHSTACQSRSEQRTMWLQLAMDLAELFFLNFLFLLRFHLLTLHGYHQSALFSSIGVKWNCLSELFNSWRT
uniref:Uncharacterized protein n=1 Tax=Anguilla anguilla TaxID=7936 RepID=A0A0E9X1A6_ANGAN